MIQTTRPIDALWEGGISILSKYLHRVVSRHMHRGVSGQHGLRVEGPALAKVREAGSGGREWGRGVVGGDRDLIS